MAVLAQRLITVLFLFGLFCFAFYLFTYRPFVFASFQEDLPRRASASRIREDVERLTNFGPRSIENPQLLSTIADDLVQSFRKTNARVSLQTFTVAGSPFSNVLSEYGFSNKRGTLVIGAHYDTTALTPGADDNASGIAGLLELGRLLADSPPPVKVLLVAFTNEEMPFFNSENMGSFIHATSLKAAGEDVSLMISLESIGYYSDLPNSQRYPLSLLNWIYPSTGNFIAIVDRPTLSGATLGLKRAFARATQLPAYSINAPESVPGIAFSDHLSYWRVGFPAVMITDTAMYRNPNYHQATDVPPTLNFDRIAAVIDGVSFYVESLEP